MMKHISARSNAPAAILSSGEIVYSFESSVPIQAFDCFLCFIGHLQLIILHLFVCLFVWRDRPGKGSLCYTTLVIYYLPARQCSVKLTLFCHLRQLISEPLQHFVCSFFAFLKETDRAQKWIELGHIREVANFWLSIVIIWAK